MPDIAAERALAGTEQAPRLLRLLSAAVNTDKLKTLQEYLEHGGRPNATVFREDDPDARPRYTVRESDAHSALPRRLSILAMYCAKRLPQHVKTLIEAGANVQQAIGLSPLALTARMGALELMDMLISKGADINGKGKTPLFMAASEGAMQSVIFLTERGADLDQCCSLDAEDVTWANLSDSRTEFWGSAICSAALNGHLDVVKYLHSKGAELRVKDGDHIRTVLHFSVRQSHTACTEWLIANGVEIDAEDECNATALHWAVDHGNAPATCALIEAGADVNALTCDGQTPLHRAAWKGELEVAMLLIQHPETEAPKDKEFKNFLDVAAHRGNADWLRAVMSSEHWQALPLEYKIETERTMLCHVKDVRTLNQIIKSCSDLASQVAFTDVLGYNSLHMAAYFGRPVPLICKLIKLGVDCSAQNKDGSTPADVARSAGHGMHGALLDRAALDHAAV